MPILLIAYESLKATRAREVEELDPRPYEDFTVEEFLEKLPGPTLEEVDEPMDAAGSSEDAPADLPLGEMAELSNQDTSNVPMETDAPESSPQGKASGCAHGGCRRGQEGGRRQGSGNGKPTTG